MPQLTERKIKSESEREKMLNGGGEEKKEVAAATEKLLAFCERMKMNFARFEG